jgi:voltage-gated potassium channel
MLAATFGEELRNRKLQLESEIAHALEDGIVSKHERKILDKLAEELHVSGDVLERLIDSGMLQKSIESQCPHCKKTISKRSA